MSAEGFDEHGVWADRHRNRAQHGGRGGLDGLWLMLFGAFVGCQDYAFINFPNRSARVEHIGEMVLTNTDVDILFVVDNSGSMSEEQENLIVNTALFVEELSLLENAYRIGVISTDALDEGREGNGPLGLDAGRLRFEPASVSRLATAGCSIEPSDASVPYLERPDPESPTHDAERCRLVEDFRETVASLGTDGSGREAGLLAAELGLSTDSDAAERNLGFLRDDADLALILLTDEDDCSFENYDGRWINKTCYDRRTEAIGIEHFVSFYGQRKQDIRKVRAALIGGGVWETGDSASFVASGCHLTASGASADCGCWSSALSDDFFCNMLGDFGHLCEDTEGCRSSETCASVPGDICDVKRCDALPASRYHKFIGELSRQRVAANAPSGTYEDSICRGSYGEALLDIVYKVVAPNCFELNQPPFDPDSVQMVRQRIGTETDAVTEQTIPRLHAEDPNTGCQSCGDCPEGAWEYHDKDTTMKTICLTCGLHKGMGDIFELQVLSDVVGFEDGGPQ